MPKYILRCTINEGNQILDKEKLEAVIFEKDVKIFKRSSDRTQYASFCVVNADAFEAAYGLEKALVMNFANAHRPGGGFLNGARAQEESLCWCSTLYKSISSDKARERDIGILSWVLGGAERLATNGIVIFDSDVLNGAVFWRRDVLGNDLVKILITLREGEDFWACTNLDVKEFPKKRKSLKNTRFKIIK